jgi:hypothetical protein
MEKLIKKMTSLFAGHLLNAARTLNLSTKDQVHLSSVYATLNTLNGTEVSSQELRQHLSNEIFKVRCKYAAGAVVCGAITFQSMRAGLAFSGGSDILGFIGAPFFLLSIGTAIPTCCSIHTIYSEGKRYNHYIDAINVAELTHNKRTDD